MYYILFISYMLCKLDILLTGLMDILIIFGFTLLTVWHSLFLPWHGPVQV